MLLKSLNRAITEFKQVSEYIAGIEDDYIKQLFFLRYGEGLSWKHVAAAAGGKKTVHSVRRACERYMQKNN